MNEAEFDKFADEYRQLHAANVALSGETPEYFSEYKVADAAAVLAARAECGALDILDFGAGVGTSVPYMRRYFPDCRLICLDVSRRSLAIGAARFPDEARYVHFDGGAIPAPDATFDLVFVACVLHHVPHDAHPPLLREMHRVLRPGGSLVIFEHNPFNPLTVHAVNTCPFDDNAVLIRARALASRVRAAGFRRAVIDYRLFFPRVLRALRRFERHLAWLPLGAQYRIHAVKS